MVSSAKIFAVGNSNAIRLPRLVMDSLGLKTGDPVTMEVEDEMIIVRKKPLPKTYPSIKELFAGYTGDYRPVEMDADDNVGREMI